MRRTVKNIALLGTIVLLLFVGPTTAFSQGCPNFEWAKKAGGSGNDVGSGIALDSWGNSYITGQFGGSATFGSTTLTSSSVYDDIFITKLDANGNFLWAKKAGGSGTDIGNNIAIDNQGNSYVTGYFQNTATFGSTTLTSSSVYDDIFIAKLDVNGNFLWAKKAGGNGDDFSYGIAIDSQGNSYVTGKFDGIATFGSTTLTSSGGYDIFIAKLDVNGNFLWAKKAGGSGTDIGNNIAIDNQGNSYVTGYFQNTATFGNTTLTDSGYWGDIFIAKLDANGNFLWAKKQAGGSNNTDEGRGIAVDSQGNSYVTGYFVEIATFGSTTLTNSSETYGDVFITKLDANGNFLWAKQAGGFYDDKSNSIAVDSQGNCYITGRFQYTTTFGSTSLTSNGDYDIFITKITESTLSVSPMNNLSITCGETFNILANAQNYTTLQWSPTTGLDNPNSLTPVASPAQTTTYTLSITDVCGNAASENITISVTPLITTASATNTTINCGASTEINTTLSTTVPNATYSWSPTQGLSNPNIANPTASPGLTTTYTVTVSSPNGCSSTDDVTINVNNPNPPTVNIQSNTGEFKLCNNGLSLSAPGFASYEWSNENGVVGTSPTYTVTQPGNYSLIVYETSGCAGTASVSVSPLAEITAPDGTVFCSNQPNNTLKLQATLGMDSYQWNTGDNTSAINVSQPGTYSVTVTKGSCTYTISIQVTVSNGQASADFSHSSNGLEVHFQAISTSINFLSWDFGDGSATDFNENTVHTYANAGTYDVSITITDVCGNTASKTKSITVSETTGYKKESKKMISIYPNPTNSAITIESGVLLKEVNIKSMQGKIIRKQVVNDYHTSINLSFISKGIYIIETIDVRDEKQINKIIKN